jgi:hypothetical protein
MWNVPLAYIADKYQNKYNVGCARRERVNTSYSLYFAVSVGRTKIPVARLS